MPNTLFIADTHFFHYNVIGYENRPFDSVEEMNRCLIKNWNKAVKNNDKIFMLGDFALTNKQNIKSIIQKLNGYKILILGNHDQYSPKFYIEAGFDEVYRYPVILNNLYVLSHAPMNLDDNVPYINIFGHIHGSKEYKDYTNRYICVSVERSHMNYSPISLNNINKMLSSN